MIKSLIWRLYAYRFFDDFILIYPLYQVMFVDKGLNIMEISWLFVIWSVTSLIAEIPTGVFADRYSRKNLLALGQLIRAIGFLAWLFAPSFWGFAVGFALWGIGSAFDSGTYEALLYDELKAIGREKEYVSIQGKGHSFSLAGNFFATALAAVAVLFGYPVLLLLSAFAVVISAWIAWTLPKASARKEVADLGYFAELWAGAKEALHNPVTLNIILLSGFIIAVFGSLEEYAPLFFQELHWSLSGISLGQAAIVLATIIASIIAYKFEQLSPTRFLLLLGFAGVSLAGVANSGALLAPILLGGFFFLTKLLETIFDGKLQHSIQSHRRATITSVGGFLAEVISLGLYAGFGALANTGGTIQALSFMGMFVVGAAVVFIFMNKRLSAPLVP